MFFRVSACDVGALTPHLCTSRARARARAQRYNFTAEDACFMLVEVASETEAQAMVVGMLVRGARAHC